MTDAKTSQPEFPMTINECIECLRYPEEFPAEAIGQILTCWDEAAEPLLDALRDSLDEADDPEVEPEELDEVPFQAAYLFAQFHHKQAFPELLRLVRHPLCEDLLGDFLLEGLPKCLASCWSGEADTLRDVVFDRSVNEYARVAAWSALLCLTAWGERGLESLQEDLADLLEDSGTLGSGFLAGSLVMSATQIPADAEVVALARSAYADGHVEVKTFPVKEFETELERFDAVGWQEMLAQLHGVPVVDASEEIEQWFGGEDDSDSEEEWVPSEPVEQLASDKIGRNDPCPCKSGMKYKKCCGKES
jgi:uncharacterized protein YchJ